MQINAAGQVELKLETPRRAGTTHLVLSPDARQSLRAVVRRPKGPSSARLRLARLSPMEFMQRLAALVPRPRLHLIRFHGVLAPNAKLRAFVVPLAPAQPDEVTEAAAATESAADTAQGRTPAREGAASSGLSRSRRPVRTMPPATKTVGSGPGA